MRLWLDDVRDMPEDYDFHVSNVEDAISILEEFEVEHISLDHDLGTDKTGYDLACWIEQNSAKGLPRMTWSIHSANPVGAQKMKAAMEMANRYWRAVDSMCQQHLTFQVVLGYFKSLPKTLFWYTHRNPFLGPKTPAQMILDGEENALIKYIEENFVNSTEEKS